MIDLFSGLTIVDYNIAAGDDDELTVDLNSAAKFLGQVERLSGGAIYFNCTNFKLGAIEFTRVGVELYKYDGLYDLLFYFDEDEVFDRISTEGLRGWATQVSKSVASKRFFCGYEPSPDRDTRFLSDAEPGPLKPWSGGGE